MPRNQPAADVQHLTCETSSRSQLGAHRIREHERALSICCVGFDGGQCLACRPVVAQVLHSMEEQEMRYFTTALVATTLLATASVHAQQTSNQAPQSGTAAGNSTATSDQDQ